MRAAYPAFHLLQGPGYRPSALSIVVLCSKNATFEVVLLLSLLGVWRANMAMELAFSACAAASCALLCHWYRDLLPPGVTMRGRLLHRVAITAVTLGLHRLFRHHLTTTTARQGRGGTCADADAAADPSTSSATGGSRLSQKLGAEAAVPVGGAGSGADGVTQDFVDTPKDRTGHSLQLYGSFSCTCGPSGGTSTPGGSELAAAPPELRGCMRGPGAAAALAAPDGAARPAVAGALGATADGGLVTSLPVQGPNVLMLPRIPYRSPIQRRAVHIKIPWAEPEELTPGYEQRLRSLAAAQGLGLAGVYVWRGCVELMLVLEAPRGGQGEGKEEEEERQTEPPAGVLEPPRWQLDSGIVLAALGLGQRPGNGKRAAGGATENIMEADWPSGAALRLIPASGSDPAPWGPQSLLPWEQQVERAEGVLPTGRSAAVAVGAPHGEGGGRIRVTGLVPRVLCLAPETGTDGLPVLRLSLALSGALRLRLADQQQQRSGQEEEEEKDSAAAVQQAGAQRHEPEDDSAAVAAAAAAGGLVEIGVAVLAANTVLPARVTARGLRRQEYGGSNAPHGRFYEHVYEYDIKLLDSPPLPGTMLLELRLRTLPSAPNSPDAFAAPAAAAAVSPSSGRWHRLSLPLLATADAAVAAELAAAAVSWPHESLAELDELMYDVGSWAATASATVAAAAAVTVATVAGDAPSALGRHLLSYALSAGWEATSAWIREDLSRLLPDGGGRGDDGGGAFVAALEEEDAVAAGASDSDTARGAGGQPDGSSNSCGAAVEGGGDASGALDDGVAAGRRVWAPSGPPRPAWFVALQWVLGLRRTAPAEAAAFRAFADAYTDGLGLAALVVECLVLLILFARGLRAGQPSLSLENVVLVVGCGTGTLATAAWLMLPRPAWLRLVRASRLPRLLGYCASKALLLVARRAPSGAAAYAGGPGMLLLEGIILPCACMMPPRTALLISALKLPLNWRCHTLLGIGGGSQLVALGVAARVEVAALATNLGCQLYLRRRFAEQQQRGQGERPGATGGSSKGSSGCGRCGEDDEGGGTEGKKRV